MTKRNLRYAGLGLAVLTVGALAACGSSDAPTTPTPTGTAGAHTGSGGAAATAGAATATAGAATGTAGAATGTAGAATGTAGAGTGGGATGSGFACAGGKPTSTLITSFADLVANTTTAGSYTFTAGVPGGTFTYQPAALTLATDGMALNVTGNVNNYDGFGVYFNSCMDASACTGISFSVKGSVGYTGKLNFRVQSNADTAIDTTNMKGACMVPAGTDSYTACHDSAVDVPVTTAGAVQTVMFSQLAGGVPKAAITGNDIVGLEWAFNWTAAPAAGTGGTGAGGGAGAAAGGATNGAFMANVTIDDVQFVGCTGLTGGAGAGAGGASGTAGASTAGGAGGASGGSSPGGTGSGGAHAGSGG